MGRRNIIIIRGWGEREGGKRKEGDGREFWRRLRGEWGRKGSRKMGLEELEETRIGREGKGEEKKERRRFEFRNRNKSRTNKKKKKKKSVKNKKRRNRKRHQRRKKKRNGRKIDKA